MHAYSCLTATSMRRDFHSVVSVLEAILEDFIIDTVKIFFGVKRASFPDEIKGQKDFSLMAETKMTKGYAERSHGQLY